MAKRSLNNEPIALVGYSLRFPGANSPSELWELLRQPRDISEDFPPNRMNLKSYYHSNGDHHGTTNVQKSYLISQDHRVFDAAFFNITPMEAEVMDPQQRILLEVVYEAMESGGFTIESLQGSQTSVFVGVMSSDFSAIQLQDGDTIPTYAVTGAASSILSNRISYFFDWKGSSMTIDTACSSSLVAVHQAVQSLRNSESQLAVVGGVNIILSPEPYIAESKLHMLSPSSKSMMWDIRADGYARGDGVAVVMLKKLSQAVKDHDNIMSVIRETMVNSDGRTAGITMPSASAQAALIRQTYERAGLDCCQKADRCQYFEAHGTGTPTGDPIEAEAVRNAFFPEDRVKGSVESYSSDEFLYIGSIKTVIGHLEGCAGLAGLLKASLAVQKGVILPNLHFDTLNPAIEPFYAHFKVPTVAQPWPNISPGSPRRVSVNSFGFGGTNAHAIVESYTPECLDSDVHQSATVLRPAEVSRVSFAGPFVFSANSESSLLASVKAFSSLLKNDGSIDLVSLSWMLQSRRTVLPIRAAFSGVTRERLLSSMDEQIQKSEGISHHVGICSRRIGSKTGASILGIFTGQGAQWPQMGRELIIASKVFEQVIESLQESIASLPDPPQWSLKVELMSEPSSSRISEAVIGQPLCTAVQIALTDLLRHAGVSFGAVVGHSSGEIAAAYAAGYLSPSDAIRIAYYRGYHAMPTGGTGGCAGAMIAVGMSFKDALEFCQTSQFAGRVYLAASNAPTSVTLSGDADAIQEAQKILEVNYSTKLLRVDKAYHSHHMRSSAEPYIRSLRACNIQTLTSDNSCVWISSVTKHQVKNPDSLKDVYWADNMVQPVFFSEAIEQTMRDAGPFDIAIEVGPHSTLEGPVIQTMKSVVGSAIPYCALLSRGRNDVESFSRALGYVWGNVWRAARIDFDGYRRAFEPSKENLKLHVLGHLPSYSWDHKHIYWKESRISRNGRFRKDHIHELLGYRRPDDSLHEMRWRNIIRLEEIPWLRGHAFQGQVVFPGAGYVVMALEASKFLTRDRQVVYIELQDITIYRALVISNGSAGVETSFTLKCLKDKDNTLVAEFVCSSCSSETDASLKVNSSGQIRIILGEPSQNTLPSRIPVTQSMLSIDIDRFYHALSDLGLDYTGLFRALKEVRRTTYMSTCLASWSHVDMETSLTLHSAILDVAFQSIFASVGSVASVRNPYLPTHIQRIRVNTVHIEAEPATDVSVTIDAYTTDISSPSRYSPPTISGDVDIFGEGDHLAIQVEGLTFKPISESNASSDRRLFYETVWDVDISSGIATGDVTNKDLLEESELPELLERLSHVHFRDLFQKTPKGDIATFEWYHQRIFEYMEYLFSTIDHGRHPIIKKEWANDTREQLFAMIDKFPETIDFRTANAVAENFPAILKGKITTLEVLTKENMLSHLYNDALGLSRGYGHIARMAKQIAHRYPRLKVFEIGAGTGATTSRVLDSIDGAFSSYVYTDISIGFFEKARERFKKYANRMEFKTFNVENDVVDQGFAVHSFDVVVASSVLHATRRLKDTLENSRRLLKPGGYLLFLEPTGNSLRTTFVMCGLPGWWLGGEDGRRLFPGVTEMQWDVLLRETGFSGVDTLLHDTDDPSKHMYSAIVSQAVDDKVNMIRQPLQSVEVMPQIDQFLIIGGKTLQVSRLIHNICELLPAWKHCTLKVDDLESLDEVGFSPATTVLCLTELDKPIFESMTINTFRGMQQLFDKARRVLWVTRNCRMDNPHSNMTVGAARVLLNEMPHLILQMLDISGSLSTVADGRALTDVLLRLVMTDMLDDSLLWTTEPELSLEGGILLIPRILPDKDLNDRLNSPWRTIQKEISATAFTLDACHSNGRFFLRQGKLASSLQPALPGHVRIRVDFSLAFPVKIMAATYLYLCIGSVIGTGQRAIAFSRLNSSIIETYADWMFVCEVPANEEEQHLQSVAAELVAENLLSAVPAGAVLLLHEPEISLANTVAQRARLVSARVMCTTSQLPLPESNMWTHIHPLAPKRQVKSVLPSNVAGFVDCSESPHSNHSNIRMSLPHSCTVQEIKEFFGDEAKINADVHVSTLQKHLVTAVSHSKLESVEKSLARTVHKVMAKELSNVTIRRSNVCVVNWAQEYPYLVNVKPLNPREFFSTDKTYLLVGLTGDLGQSLCRWMTLNGACNIVLTSRRASVNPQWLEDMHNKNANVQVFPMDITDKQALLSVYSKVCSTMPPIAGVINGAMVLSDALFADMTFEALTDVLGPKVEGTKNLDELFGYQNLDFFIMLSSVSAIAGDRGQSNYAAANMFMAGLAARRRRKRLAASVIDIGMLTEIGYVSRADRALEQYLRKKNHCLPISEPEFHQMFIEAIFAGRPGSEHQPEIITGLQGVRQSLSDDKPPWFYNPRFSHCILEEAELEKKQGETVVVQIRQQLSDAPSAEEAVKILREAFTQRLAMMLQISQDSIDEKVPLINLGVDSLISIEIRSWFIKEVSFDVPVLKVLSGGTIIDLCEDAIEKLTALGLKKPEDTNSDDANDNSDEPGVTTTNLREDSNMSRPPETGPISTPPTDEEYQNRKNEHPDIQPNMRGGEDTEAREKYCGNFRVEQAPAADSIYGHHHHTLPAILNLETKLPAAAGADESTLLPDLLTTKSTEPVMPQPHPNESEFVFENVEKMSYAQSRLWFLKTYSENPTSYNVVLSYDIKGPLHVPRFEKALRTIVSRHQVFRTSFFMQTETGEGMQGVHKEPSINLDQRKISNDTEVQEEFDRMRNHRFELEKGKTFLATLLTRTPSWSTIMFGYHHILMDASSFFLFLREVDKAYRLEPLKPQINQYVDFTSSQRRLIRSGKLAHDLAFWKNEFSDLPPSLPLFEFSRVRSRFASNAYGIHTGHGEIRNSHAMEIKRKSQELRITPFHFHLAAIQSFLFKLLDVEDLCIGIADANRMDSRFSETIGVLLNLLPLRFRCGRTGQVFADIAKNTSQKVLETLAHSRVPFEMLLDELNMPRSLAHTPLFQVFVNYRMGAYQQASLGDCELRHRAVNDATLPYDLLVTITEPTKESCFVSFTLRDDLYNDDACRLLVRSYTYLLGQLCDNPLRSLDDYSLFSDFDARLGIDLGKGPKKPCIFPETLSHRIDALLESTPDDIAVKDGYGYTFTYAQLAKRSYIIASALSEAGTTIGSYVVVLLEPTSDTIASLLAILRLGAVYVPFDLQNPPARLVTMTKDCRPTAIICEATNLDTARSLSVDQATILDLSSLIEMECAATEDYSQMDLPAFALYTSGSTGTPKGILITQANLLNGINGSLDRQSISPKEVVLQQSSLGFDLSLYQIFCALITGGKLIVAPQMIRGHIAEVSKLMLAENVTFTLATPSEYSVMLCYGRRYLKQCSSWKLACSAGENMASQLTQEFRQLGLPNLILMNWFGPTEVGVFSIANIPYTDSRSSAVDEYPSIGRPLANVSVYIVDEQLRPVPTGFPGEICVGGAGCSLGYIGDNGVTKEKFIPNSFAEANDLSSGWDRLYRSGDKGRLLDDGSIMFLGRIGGDSQIKLRGFRIELDDVANSILHAAKGYLTDATVSVRGDPQFLVGFVVFSPDYMPSDPAGFLRKLSSEIPLPEYMCPGMIIPVHHLPRTTNGKRDRAALDTIPLPISNGSEREVQLSSTESQLRILWMKALPSVIGKSQIDGDTGFFHAGGSSILLMKLQALVHEFFGVELALVELFQYNALGSMASRIDFKRNHSDSGIVSDVSERLQGEEERKGIRSFQRGDIDPVLQGTDQGSVSDSAENAIDWEMETAVSDALPMPMESSATSSAPSKSITVLLTGSTAVFGRAVLRRLVGDSRVAKVHCVAVPKADEFSPAKHTSDYAKVEVHVGSLSMTNIGLCETEIERLSKEVDVIVHAAGDGSFLNSYQSLRSTYLGTTKELVRIAVPRRVPIHFVSSSRVGLFAGRVGLGEISVARFHPPTDSPDGLTAVKWACERYLENVTEKLGLPVWVHRSCSVISENAPPTDVLNAILKYSLLLRAVPILENTDGFIDYAPIETIASGLLRHVMGSIPVTYHQSKQLTFVHHTSGQRIRIKELKKHLEEKEECPFEELPLIEWKHQSKQLGISEIVTAALEVLRTRKDPVYFPLLLKTNV